MKKLLLGYLIRFLFGAIALGVGIWYVSSSLSGASLTYTSMDSFLNSIGASDGNIASTSGCFLCEYVNDLFFVLGNASESFWRAIVSHLWILMVIGFGVFLFIHSAKYIYKAMMETTKLDTGEKKLAFGPWFDDVWKNGVRIMIVGAIIGAFGMGGVSSIKTLSNITIQPVMYVGTELSMAATNLSSAVQCVPAEIGADNPMASVSNSFMCIVGNINSVMLAGAAGGFALMNYAWMGLGGGAFTWIAGLLIVIMFVVIGFNLFFEILSVIFKLVFLVIFLPLLAAAAAFEKTWKKASGIVNGAIKTLVEAAIKVVAISLKVVIVYAMVFFAADEFFPGPVDKYSAIFPPMLVGEVMPTDAKALSIRNVFATCESAATIDGTVDKTAFKNCFNLHRAQIESRYPGAFDFMRDGWGFLLLMGGLIFIYFYVLAPRVDKLLASVPSFEPFRNSGDSDGGGIDNFGADLKKLIKMTWKRPQEFADKLIKEK
jgi:hypothetical protein